MTSAARSSACANNEIFVFTQPRPARSVHRCEGWSAQSIAEHAMPALKAGFTPLEVSARRVFLGPGLNRRETLEPRSSS